MDTELIDKIDDEQEEKELSPAEIYNLKQQQIKKEIENPLPRLGDKVLVDIDWTLTCGREPNPTIKGRITGIDYEKYFVRLSIGGGNTVPVYPEATKLRYD
jgi:hypothetical protein